MKRASHRARHLFLRLSLLSCASLSGCWLAVGAAAGGAAGYIYAQKSADKHRHSESDEPSTTQSADFHTTAPAVEASANPWLKESCRELQREVVHDHEHKAGEAHADAND